MRWEQYRYIWGCEYNYKLVMFQGFLCKKVAPLIVHLTLNYMVSRGNFRGYASDKRNSIFRLVMTELFVSSPVLLT